MKRKTMKAAAATALLTFGCTAFAAPAMADSSNIVAETSGVYTLTLPQIQQLAVINNDTLTELELTLDQIELQEKMTRNQRRKVQTQLNSMDYDDSAISGLLTALNTKIENNEADYTDMAAYSALYAQQVSTANTIESAAESALDGLDQLDDALDALEDGAQDIEDAIADLEQIMRYSSAQLALAIVQVEDSIELLEGQMALLDKSMAIYERQKELGMATSIDVETQQLARNEAANTLRDTEEQLDVLKRSLNVLIGRNASDPLEVVPMQLNGVINTAPAFTAELVDKFIAIDPQLESLQEDKDDLKDSVESDMGSDERKNIDYQIKTIDLQMKTQKQTAENNLKSMLATINSNAEKYQNSKDNLLLERRNHAIAEKKYELGMISGIELQQADLMLAQAELQHLSCGYQHYFDWQKYYLAEKGVDVSAL